MRFLLIHSLLVGFSVNPIYTVEENGTIYTLDGSQRTSTCIEFLKNKFALSKDVPEVAISVKENGEQVTKNYSIAGKSSKNLMKRYSAYCSPASWNFAHCLIIQMRMCVRCLGNRIPERV